MDYAVHGLAKSWRQLCNFHSLTVGEQVGHEAGRRDLYEGGRAMLSPRGQEDTDPPSPSLGVREQWSEMVSSWVREPGRERRAPPTKVKGGFLIMEQRVQ